ncbi:transposase [Streptomyces sp. NPDC096310]|uniref:transposase n=1 Tax=Streptomyces sp. NPDC096310 TaxID=3366082 RepID=UPI0038306F2D
MCRLYLDIPPGTLLVSVDAKTGIQAKSRRYPTRRTHPGQAERREYEYRRHGTVSIVAAMDVATGQVLAERMERNGSSPFIAFLRRSHRLTDPVLRLHLIMDNGSSHTSRATRAPPANHRHPHAQACQLAEHGRAVVRRPDPPPDPPRRLHLPQGLEAQITASTIRHNRTARPYQWRYDADADHARHPQTAPAEYTKAALSSPTVTKATTSNRQRTWDALH